MIVVHDVLTAIALLAAGVIYGTDMFCALVQRSALRHVDDEVLTKVMGYVHFYGDKRLAVPGAISVIATVLTTAAAAAIGDPAIIAADAAAILMLAGWFGVFLRISAPVNKRQTSAAEEGRTPDDARSLQERWDSVINLRAGLQGLAVAALLIGAVAGS
ncbi:DUF1772 domain-containing protein [Actinomadura litoris]|uniref:DUF1772 domain-containing protein n=1 Tax=Actinomadura litoris TaxID=2678616 RepID=UPI001FA80425|nr:DUF1772 domain-containing protein [Actinomadura litoris]